MSVNVCLITGGAGFIGCAISHAIADRFDQVVALDNLSSQVHASQLRPARLHNGVRLVIGDVCDLAAWDHLLSTITPTTVIHLAAETGTGQSLRNATSHAKANVCGTTIMLDAFVRHEKFPRRFVLASSRAVYGEGAWISDAGREIIYPGQRSRQQLLSGQWDFPGYSALPSRGAVTQPNPASIYGATKLAQEHVLKAWTASFGSDLTILRLQNVYGPGQSLTNSYTGIVPLFCRIARAHQSIPLYEDGKVQRDFVFIDDVASAFARALDRPESESGLHDVGTGRLTTISDIAQRIAMLYGAPEPHVCGEFRFGDVRHASCSVEDTAYGLNWTPNVDLADGIAKLVTWIEDAIQ
jgi:dTDP-L-rhamnose 4-epimerase